VQYGPLARAETKLRVTTVEVLLMAICSRPFTNYVPCAASSVTLTSIVRRLAPPENKLQRKEVPK